MRRSLVLSLFISAVACTVQYQPPATATAADEHLAHMSAADLQAPARPGLQASQGTPGLPPSNMQAAARLEASPRHGEWVKIAWEPGSADSLMAWIVHPMGNTRAPVVVVVHEIFGLSTWVRGVADQLAADGFIAIAPDILSRVRGGPSTVELSGDSARRIIQGVNIAERNRAIVAAANYAMTLPSAMPRYAVIGYCWGGTTTFAHAVHGGVQGFAAGVAYYGSPYVTGGSRATATAPATPARPDADSLAKIRVPVMLLNGAVDQRISAMMPAIDSIMKALGKNYTGVDYPGAVHGFLRAQADPSTPRNEEREQANLAATRDAWPRTISFLKQHLGVR